MLKNNIFINFVKMFLNFSSVTLLKQHVNFLNLSTNKEKIKVVAKLIFSKTLNDFETYFDFIDWFHDYIESYVEKFEFLQNKKIYLLKESSKSNNVRKFYALKTKFTNFIAEKLNAFHELQKHFFKIEFLIYYDSKRQLYANLNTNEKDIKTMIYHVKNNKNFELSVYSFRKSIQSILLFGRLLSFAEMKYWLTKLEMTELVWMFRKLKHMIKLFNLSSIIYIDHDASLSIAKQISLTISSTDKLYLRFVKAFEYDQRFDLIIRHKSNRLQLVSNALSRFLITDMSTTNASNVSEYLDRV